VKGTEIFKGIPFDVVHISSAHSTRVRPGSWSSVLLEDQVRSAIGHPALWVSAKSSQVAASVPGCAAACSVAEVLDFVCSLGGSGTDHLAVCFSPLSFHTAVVRSLSPCHATRLRRKAMHEI